MARDYQSEGRKWFQGVLNELTAAAERAIENAVKEGEELTKRNIEMRGTTKSGKRGRVETGRMRDSVTSGIVSRDAQSIVGRFGFENAPYYAEYQEGGFTHTSGVDVEGMFALSDAGEEIIQNLEEDLEREFRGL